MRLRIGLAISVVFIQAAFAGQPCAVCHPRETAGFEKTAMAHSLSAISVPPEGTFHDPFSGTTFETRSLPSGDWQRLRRPGESETVQLKYVIGSGAHAFGFLAQIGNHLFQSPIAYYTVRHAWGMAPGYQGALRPNFSRPVTLECLTCHSDRPRAVADTVNSYLDPPVAGGGIQCERCHGDVSQHLKRPVPGSIINPAKLPVAARDS
ncbi:MAG: multiheme c-type cytochrome, partial [Bryobacteraceae bacterium]